MSTPNSEELKKAINTLEAQRTTLGDSVTDIAVEALKQQLNELLAKENLPKKQRKMVTILFVDIVNSTHLMEGRDPEETMEIMDASLQQLATPIQNFGGRVTRFMGDGFLAVFGLLTARENDPEMAIRAGLDILDVTKKISQSLQNQWDLQGFQVRVGISTGLVVTGGITEAEDTVMGNTVNLASRLESQAPPGGILISQSTFQHVKGLFDFEERQRFHVKGFSEPIQTYLVHRAKTASFRADTRGIEGIDIPMIGRANELQVLKEIHQSTVENSHNQLITIVGGAGLGKSRLLYEFENWLESLDTQHTILKARATSEFMSLPYRMLRNLIVHRFDILDNDPINIVKTKLLEGVQDVFANDENLEANIAIVGQLLGYDFSNNPIVQGMIDTPRKLHDKAFRLIVNYLKALANEVPVIFFLDDIHWADESSLEIFHRLARELADKRILMISLARPLLFERRPSWGEGSLHLRINLYALTPEESQRLVREVLKKVVLIPETLLDLLVSNTGGNPFYIEELVKMLLEDGIIKQDSKKWRVVQDRLTTFRVPSTLTGVIQARLDNLKIETKKVLQQAAVVGRTFWDSAIQNILNAEETNNIDLHEILIELLNKELIMSHDSSTFASTNEYSFRNTVLREVTYQSVLKQTRQEYHGMVAEWLVTQSGERVLEVSGLIALHFENAKRMEDALKYITKAAAAALANFAIEEADIFYSRALSLTSEDDLVNQYNLLLGKEKVLDLQGNRIKQKEILDTLERVTELMGDKFKQVVVLLNKTWYAYWTSNFSYMLELAQKSKQISEKLDNLDLVQKAIYAEAWAYHELGETDKALEYANDALILARKLEDVGAEGSVLNILGMSSILQGEYIKGRDHLQKFLSITRDIEDKNRELTALNNIAVISIRLGDLKSGEDYIHQQMKLGNEMGDQVTISTSLINLAWIKSISEKWEIGLQYAEDGLKLKREFQHIEGIAEGLMWAGHCYKALGKLKKATRAFQEALNIRRELKQKDLEMGALAGLAKTALLDADVLSAQEYVEQILEYFEEGGDLKGAWERLRIYLTCYEVLSEVDDIRAGQILLNAYEILKEEESKIPGVNERGAFIENIPWHRKIIELHEKNM